MSNEVNNIPARFRRMFPGMLRGGIFSFLIFFSIQFYGLVSIAAARFADSTVL